MVPMQVDKGKRQNSHIIVMDESINAAASAVIRNRSAR